MTSQELTAPDGPIARTPVWMNVLMAPGNAVAGRIGRSTLRTTVSLVVWGLIVTDVGLAATLAANGTLGAAIQSMSHRPQPHIAVALGPHTASTAASSTAPTSTQVATAGPNATFISEQVVARPTPPPTTDLADPADTADRPAPRQRAARRPTAPLGPTVATDRHAAHDMRGLF